MILWYPNTTIFILKALYMAWSKVEKGRKPIGWWYHKIMCELGWLVNPIGNMYYDHLQAMINKYNLNLYGEQINEHCKECYK